MWVPSFNSTHGSEFGGSGGGSGKGGGIDMDEEMKFINSLPNAKFLGEDNALEEYERRKANGEPIGYAKML
jgi:hypothetical protein